MRRIEKKISDLNEFSIDVHEQSSLADNEFKVTIDDVKSNFDLFKENVNSDLTTLKTKTGLLEKCTKKDTPKCNNLVENLKEKIMNMKTVMKKDKNDPDFKINFEQVKSTFDALREELETIANSIDLTHGETFEIINSFWFEVCQCVFPLLFSMAIFFINNCIKKKEKTEVQNEYQTYELAEYNDY